MLEHGGRLRLAAERYDIPLENWLDLSTGINPDAYPVQAIDLACWHRLPEDDDGLEAAAADYYGNHRLLALPGSQAAIQSLPQLFRPGFLACVAPLYQEHPHAWERAGHKLRKLPTLQRALAAATPNVLLCNPNNPSASMLARETLLDAAQQLAQRGGWLIVDEAFADVEPENCVTPLAGSDVAPNLLVLRSLGKFFGLAGARVGFLFGAAEKRDGLREILGPWAVSHPARAVARQALTDREWQLAARMRLKAGAQRLHDLLAPLGEPQETQATALFCTLKTATVESLAAHFASRAILTRRFDEYGLLRFGLPGSEIEWQRLTRAVDEWRNTTQLRDTASARLPA